MADKKNFVQRVRQRDLSVRNKYSTLYDQFINRLIIEYCEIPFNRSEIIEFRAKNK